jgi:cbb3-type cytochrome oxidase subunit 3
VKLSDIVSAAGLFVYAEVALVLFLIAFIAILVDVVAKRHAEEFKHASSLPLEDAPMTPSLETQTNGR